MSERLSSDRDVPVECVRSDDKKAVARLVEWQVRGGQVGTQHDSRDAVSGLQTITQ